METLSRRATSPTVSVGVLIVLAVVVGRLVSALVTVDGMPLWSVGPAVASAAVIICGWWSLPLVAATGGVVELLVAGAAPSPARALGVAVALAVYGLAALPAHRRVTTPPEDPRLLIVPGLSMLVVPLAAEGLGSAVAGTTTGVAGQFVAAIVGLTTVLPLAIGLAFGDVGGDRSGRSRLAVAAAVAGGTIGLLAVDAEVPSTFLVCLAIPPIAAMQTPLVQSAAIPAFVGLTAGVGLRIADADLGQLRSAQALLVMIGLVVAAAYLKAEQARRGHRVALARQQQAASILDALAEGVMLVDADLRTISINPAGRALLGWTGEPGVGRTAEEMDAQILSRDGRLLDPEEMPLVRAQRGEAIEDEVYGLIRADGSRHWHALTIRTLPQLDATDDAHMVVTTRDVTDEVEADHAAAAEATQLRHRALYDSLTGLANRTLLIDRMGRARRTAERHRSATGLLMVDLDGFKAVNDDLGHAAGDEVLVQVALRLRTVLRAADTAARVGGDEFVVLCEDLDPGAAESELAGIGDRIQDLVGEPYTTAVGRVGLGASVGWAVAGPDEGVDLELLARADQTMRADKRHRKRRELPLAAAPPPVTVARDGDVRTVFIVDDDPAMVLLAERIIEASGGPLRVIGTAHDGATAIDRILRDEPDLVLCDVMMPAVSGPQVVEQVRRHRPFQAFVFWSVMAPPELERHRRDLGVPFVPKDRIEELPRALEEMSVGSAGTDPQGGG